MTPAEWVIVVSAGATAFATPIALVLRLVLIVLRAVHRELVSIRVELAELRGAQGRRRPSIEIVSASPDGDASEDGLVADRGRRAG